MLDSYQRCKNFIISEKKIILWSKTIILQGDLFRYEMREGESEEEFNE